MAQSNPRDSVYEGPGADKTPYTRELARLFAEHRYEQLPAQVVERAQLVILDTIGAMLYGRTTVPGGAAVDLVADLDGGNGVTLVGDTRRASAPAAALANGVMAHSFELDDRNTESLCHPSGTVFSAALAVGERAHVDGKRLILAFVLGHEATARVANSVNPTAWLYGFHGQGWGPTFGATAAAGVTLGLDAERMTHALGLAASSASGLTSIAYAGFSHGKCFHTGKAASSGVWAGLLAERGFQGGLTALEGNEVARGYCRVLSPEPRMEVILGGFGADYKINTRIGLKPYSCAGDMHPGIDAVFALMRRHGLRPDDIKEIRVHSFRTVPTHYNFVAPKSTIEGLMSYQHCLAAAILFGKVTPSEFTADMFADPRLHAIRSKVALDVDPEMDVLYPKVYAVRLELVTSLGTFSEINKASKGTPENPMNAEEIEAKFLDLASYRLSKARAREIVDAVRNLASLGDICKLTGLLRPE